MSTKCSCRPGGSPCTSVSPDNCVSDLVDELLLVGELGQLLGQVELAAVDVHDAHGALLRQLDVVGTSKLHTETYGSGMLL